MTSMKTYRVRFERDDMDWFAVTIPEVPGCITQSRTVQEGLRHAREALALLVGDDAAARAELLAEVVGASEPGRA
jgi:predicted RNase H-like HicB family nuclease